MATCHGARGTPTEVLGGTQGVCAPALDQRGVDRHADRLEHCAGGGKEQIAAGEAARSVEGKLVGDVQSSLSGAMRTPRSSRINVPRLNSEAKSPGPSPRRALAPCPLPRGAASETT